MADRESRQSSSFSDTAAPLPTLPCPILRPSSQALAALLVCEAADDCHGALHVVEQSVPAGDRCLLHLDARHLGADKGALQVGSC